MEDAEIARRLYNKQFESFSEQQTAYLPLRAFRERIFSEYHDQIINKQVLFAGCGDGRECCPAAEIATQVTGIDISDVSIHHAKKYCPRGTFLVMDIEHMTFENSQFDTIFSFFTVMYKEDLGSVLREFRRVLKDDGTIILAVPHPVRKMMKYNQNQNYFVKGRKTEIWKGVERFGYHRLFEDYVEAFVASKLLLTRIMEPQPIRETESTPERDISYPHFLLFSLRPIND